MKNKQTGLILGLVIVIVFSIWFYVSSKTEKTAKAAIQDSFLDDYIEYGDLSIGLMDQSLTLSDVQLADEAYDSKKIDELEFYGFEQLADWLEYEDDFPDRLLVRFSGANINVREMFENNDIHTNILERLVILGYQNVEADGELEFLYDKDDRQLQVNMVLTAEDIADFEVSMRFLGVKEKIFDELRKSEQLDIRMLMQLLGMVRKSAKSIALAEFSFEFNDDGWIEKDKRFRAIDQLVLPGAEGELVEGLKKESYGYFISQGAPKSVATEISEKIAEAYDSESGFELSTDIDNPIKLYKWFSSRSQSKYIKRLNLQVD